MALILLVSGAASIGWFWWQHHQLRLPPGIAWGNGRLDADEIDIDTKFAGRISKLFVDEGDMVRAGQVVALMDTQDLKVAALGAVIGQQPLTPWQGSGRGLWGKDSARTVRQIRDEWDR
jgi:multidrug efflux pump subunit AcrA (membrane-fusion protein)